MTKLECCAWAWLAEKNLRLTACHSEARSAPGFFFFFCGFGFEPLSVDMFLHGLRYYSSLDSIMSAIEGSIEPWNLGT
jgi:hypothetical protein